jgi:hypothetical protein
MSCTSAFERRPLAKRSLRLFSHRLAIHQNSVDAVCDPKSVSM